MKKLLPVFIFLFTFNIFSQKEANFWYFGENAGLDFSTNPPTAIVGSLSTDEGSASISDNEGVLQFYTDGSTVYDKSGAIMPNGTGLLGNSSSAQSAIIVPKPLNKNIYYIFTVTDGSNSNGVKYSEVDMSLNNGLGDVTTKNINLSASSNAQEKITSVKGEDCNTFWVITGNQNQYQAYKIDENGVNTSAVTSSYINPKNNPRGYLKIAPDGKKLVNASANSGAYIYDFNALTGRISNGARLNGIPGDSYGVEFSRDSQKLYISTGVHSQLGNNGERNSPSFASITQFNLQSNNNPTIANSGQLIYRTNTGYRGALQLAPNGKIYYARSRQNYLGVINSPEKDANAVDFVEEGIFLSNRISTEGLPPFIQSFFSIVEIKDAATSQVINDEDLQFCIGDNKIIEPNPVTGATPPIYDWEFYNGTTTVALPNPSNSPALELTNLTTANNGKYSLTISLNDDCGNPRKYIGTFNVEVFEAAKAKATPDPIIFCDTDRDGFHTFDLNAEKNAEILDGLDDTIFEVLYFDDLANANSGNNPLPNNYTNPTAFSSQTIYARVQNTKAPNACFAITSFTLAVTDLPEPTQPDPFRICDDTESGSDTDKIINTFILSNKDSEILGALDPNQYNITYHTTQTGADINDVSTVIPKNVNHSVTDNQTVYVRVENKDNVDCYDAAISLELLVDPLPVLIPNPELDHCVRQNSVNPTVNLTVAEINISTNYTNETFEYYRDIAGTDAITNPTSYPVQVNATQSVFVKVITNQGCSREIIELKLNVGETPDNAYNTLQPAECDDFLDANGNNTPGANSDTDGITTFNLDKTAIISGISPPANTEVTFYENESDRNNSLNEIDIANFRNDITKNDVTTIPEGIQFPIYYKILSTINNNCQGLGQFTVQINSTPKISAEIISDLPLCENLIIDGNQTNGSVPNTDLTQKIDELFDGTGQNKNDFTVTFYKSESAAFSGDETGTDYISSPDNFTNDIPAGFTEGDVAVQTIYIRVENKTTGCANPHASFDVIINPLPIIQNIIPVLEVCDLGSIDGDVRNGLAQNIDVSQRDDNILNGRSPNDFTVTYHKTKADLENLSSTGVDKKSFQSDPARVTINTTTNVSEEILFVRIINNATGCLFNQSTLTIRVNPEPVFTPPTNLAYCDDAVDGDDTNGIIQNVDLDSKIEEVLGATQNPNDFKVTFHASQSDAISGNAAIASPYQNTNPTEKIYVRIQNKITSCVNSEAVFDLIINPLPDFTVTTPQIICLNDVPFNIAVENPNDVYTYVWKDENGTVLNTNSVDNIDISVGGNYSVTATTTNGTGCSRTETIVVNESNPAILEPSFVTIIDESNNIGSEPKLSISINTIDNDLGIGDYQFAVLNTDTNERFPFAGFQDEPLFEDLEGGIYQIIVNDKNGCSPDTTLLVSVIQFPKFFTPNADGKNDTWVVKGANDTFYPNASINIFNRFGVLVAQIPIDSNGWNGTYKNKKLPSDDYWYNVTLIPADITKPTINKKGHFSLLRK